MDGRVRNVGHRPRAGGGMSMVPEQPGGGGAALEGLAGARIGLLEGRMGRELADLIERHQGVPLVAPSVREVPLDASGAVTEAIDGMSGGTIDVVVLLTGVGVDALFTIAENVGRRDELARLLAGVTTVSR